MKKNKLDIAKNLLSSGELVIFPTETVFGIGGDATNAGCDCCMKLDTKHADNFDVYRTSFIEPVCK